MEDAKYHADYLLSAIETEFTRVSGDLDNAQVDLQDLEMNFSYLKRQFIRLAEAQTKYRNLLAKDKKENEFQEICKTQDKVERRFHDIEFKVQLKVQASRSSSSSGRGNNDNSRTEDYRTKYPVRELVKFSGDVREWLPFWACFKEFDDDAHLPNIEKFRLLLQSMVPESEADKLVKSYPVSADNYSEVIKSLTSRFGRDNVIVKVYVRDLLKLVIENASGKKQNFTEIVTKISSQVRNLASLGVTEDKCAQVLYPLVESCLPEDILLAWQRSQSYEEELKPLIEFLQKEVNRHTERRLAKTQFGTIMNSHSSNNKSGKSAKSNHKQETEKTTSFAATSTGTSTKQCLFCEKDHHTQDCRKAQFMPLDKKQSIIKDKKCCLNCLKPGHLAKACKNKKIICAICSGNHYLVMCNFLNKSSSASTSKEKAQSHREKDDQSEDEPATKSSEMNNVVKATCVPLETLITTAFGRNGITKKVRVMFDSGSQKSYILSTLAKELQLEKTGEERVIHELFGGNETTTLHHEVVKLHLGNNDGSNKGSFQVRCMDRISPHIIAPRDGPWIKEFKKQGVTFSDLGSPNSRVDILIGNDVRPHCFTGNKIKLYSGPGPIALETMWGWVLTGKLPEAPTAYTNDMLVKESVTTSLMSTEVLQSQFLNHDRPIADLWSLDTIGIRDSSERESREEMDKQVIKHFSETVTRHEDGRYEVALPWLVGMQQRLPNNYFAACRRLRTTTNKLKSTGNLDQYHQIFQEWNKNQMIENVHDDDPTRDGVQYLPHRAVIRLSSLTTPVRPVFDASAKLKGHPSLNECVDKGANTLELIPAILTRFRLFKVGAVADIQKAFQQISVRPEDRECLRFLWWEDTTCQNIKIFRHTRVVFGVSASPFLLGITLNHHLSKDSENDETGDLINTARLLLQNMYVDNLVGSLPSLEQAHKFKEQSQNLLLPAKFNLRGWEFGPNMEDKDVPVLGLIWNLLRDDIRIDTSTAIEKLKGSKPTQRSLLSLAHCLFDPIGLISPFTLKAKALLRICNERKLGWDTPLPVDILNDVNKWGNQIPELEKILLPRYTFYGEAERQSLHVFCDASSSAYAAVAFLRSETKEGVKISFVQSRSRVAPKKTTTIPRLELISCTIGARLYKTIVEDINNAQLPVTFWSDSTTALAWISGPGPWGVFVTNRKQEINSLTNTNSWRHVPGRLNPADLPSRGCGAAKLAELKWWEGPSWLQLQSSSWPSVPVEIDENEVEAELRKTVVSSISIDNTHPFMKLTVLSSYPKIVRAVAYISQFKNLLRRKTFHSTLVSVNSVKSNPPKPFIPSFADLEQAEFQVIRFCQQQLKPQHMKRLRPYLDNQGILRTKTRLLHEDMDNFKHPIILPDQSVLVSLLIRWEHEKTCHIGTEMLLAHLRERFWIIKGRRTIRKVVHSCWICKRFLTRQISLPEAPLPACRTTTGSPFETVGVDAAGPLLLKKKEKVWILLFTCATYRAIHLEVVDTLSTDGFIRALRHFVARRARPTIIYSDNALNFVGAQRAISNLDWTKIQQYATIQKIEWRFNPPTASWWGGWWERMIGVVKGLLRRMLGKRVIHMHELTTLCLEVEEAVNNRPLTYISEDPDDPQPLTPNHFVKNTIIPATLPEADVLDGKSLRVAYRKLQHLREALRCRFRKEYIGQLQHYQHTKKKTQLQPGDVVIIQHDNTKRQDWPLAVVVSPIPGKDGIPRSYTLKTKGGEVIRPAQRLFPLEVSEQESTQLQNLDR